MAYNSQVTSLFCLSRYNRGFQFVGCTGVEWFHRALGVRARWSGCQETGKPRQSPQPLEFLFRKDLAQAVQRTGSKPREAWCSPRMGYSGGPQPFWHQGPVSWKTVFPQTEGGRGACSGGNASDRERQMKLRSLAHCSPPAVHPGRGLVPVHRLGVGDPWATGS